MSMAKVMEGNFNWNFELTSLDKNHLPWVFPKTESVQPTINKTRNANITLAYEAKKLIRADMTEDLFIPKPT